MWRWVRRALKCATGPALGSGATTSAHQAVLDEAVIYFVHTVPTSKPIRLGRATKRILDAELAVSAAWPSDESVRIPPSLERIERDIARVERINAWTSRVKGLRSLAMAIVMHPLTAFHALSLVREGRRDRRDEQQDVPVTLEDAFLEIEKILVDAQKVTIVERDIDADLFWSDRDNQDGYVRFFLRMTQHTVRIGDQDRTITLEPRLLLHEEGVVQITIGVHLPAGCSPADVIDASFPASPLIHTSRIPEPYARPRARWVGGEWSEQMEGGVRIRILEHEEPASIYDWLEMAVGRILQGIGASQGGPWYTYPMIMVRTGDCCDDWAKNHAQDITHLAMRAVPRDDDQIRLDPGLDLSLHTGMRVHATSGSALLLHLREWRPGIHDLHYALLYERIGLAYVRLRMLEQRISDFRTGRRDILRFYRRLLELEKEVRGTYYRAGTARDISRQVLSSLGAFEILDVVRNGASMLGERASTRASLRAARAANRFATLGLVVAVFAAIPAIPDILSLIEYQRETNPDAGAWALIQTLATSPLLLSALILTAAALYGLLIFIVISFRVIRYLLALRKRGYASRIGGYEITIDESAGGER